MNIWLYLSPVFPRSPIHHHHYPSVLHDESRVSSAHRNFINDKHSGWDEMTDVDAKGDEAPGTEKEDRMLQLRLGAEEKVTSSSNYRPYPKPIASYQDVLANRNLFMESLERLHSEMGTKFMIPVVGGRELDLHRVFAEVTTRGGFEKVIREKRWREVTIVFNFPSTATNASFVLRKYYISLLSHYEQIYLFQAKGWTAVSKPAVLNTMPCAPLLLPSPETPTAAPKRKKYNGDFAQTGLFLPVNQTVIGVIDGKFEDGYFISVTVGSTKFKGVLFHTSEQQTAVPPFSVTHENHISRVVGQRRGRKKLSSMGPGHPKPNISGYNFFFAEQHARLKLLYPGKVREISKTIGDLWTNLTDAEKSVYQERGLKDKQRYQNELAVYRDGMRRGHGVIRDVMPIQQRPLEPDSMRSAVMREDGDASPLSDGGENGTDYGTDTDGDKCGEESELQISTEAAEAAAESAGIGGEPSEPCEHMSSGKVADSVT